MVTWPMTSRDPKGQIRDPNTLKSPISRKQLEIQFSNNRYLLDSLLWGSTVGYPSDSLAFLSYVAYYADNLICLYHSIRPMLVCVHFAG